MAKTTRNVAMAMVAAAFLAAPGTSVAADVVVTDVTAPVPHVRSDSPAIRTLIQQAAERSATFRGLVDTINASDTFVFVMEGKCGHGVRSCFVSVTASGPNRYMQVLVDLHKSDRDLMGSIGHELRHTIEVIAQPKIRTSTAKFFFYELNGTKSASGAHETRAAVVAGNDVRSEIGRFDRQAKSE